MPRDPYAIADRMRLLDASGIRKVFDLAAKMKDPISLAIGQPDFDVPESVQQAAIDAIRAGENKYTQTQGTAKLRAAIAQACCEEFGWHDPYEGKAFGPRGYLVTSGTSGFLALAMLTLINPGDEVIFFDPYFVMYSHLVNLVGGVPVTVDTYPHFHPDPDKLEAAITDRTRMIIVNSPCNPTGAVYAEQELRGIAEVAAKHDLLVVSDEIYNFFCYDEPFASMVNFHDKTLLLRGFSKSHAMTGWRVGWCTGAKSIIEKMTTLQQYTFVCAPSMAQAGALKAMEFRPDEYVDAYRRKRDMVFDILGPAMGLLEPGGAFYAFVPAPGGDADAFATRAVEHNVLIIPGNVFSTRNTHFRISYATSDEKLREGLEILRDLA